MRKYPVAALLILAIPSFVAGIAQPTTTPTPVAPEDETSAIHVGDRIQIPEQSVEVNPASVKNPQLGKCSLLLGDTIEVIAVGVKDRVLIRFIDSKIRDEDREGYSACEAGKQFFLEKKRYLELREEYKELSTSEGRLQMRPFSLLLY